LLGFGVIDGDGDGAAPVDVEGLNAWALGVAQSDHLRAAREAALLPCVNEGQAAAALPQEIRGRGGIG
jgi:hypothetical protein